MTKKIEIKVPDLGDFSDIPVIEVLVEPGDSVEAEQSLVTLESDKAMMEVPTPVTGVISELRVAVGDNVTEGEVVAVIEAEERAESAQPGANRSAMPETQKTAQSEPPAPPKTIGADVSSRQQAMSSLAGLRRNLVFCMA